MVNRPPFAELQDTVRRCGLTLASIWTNGASADE